MFKLFKFEIRISKFETNSKSECSNDINSCFGHFNFGNSDLFRISDFGFLIFIAVYLLASFVFTSICFAEASVNIPLHSRSYDDLDIISRFGLTDNAGLTTKPMTRMNAARLVQKAINNIQNEDAQFSPFDEEASSRAESTLNRLVEELRPELVKLGVTAAAVDDNPPANVRFKLADPIFTQTIYADIKDGPDASYENQRGMRLKDGFNHRMRLASWVQLGDYFAFWIEPSATINKDVEDYELQTFWAKASFWNIEVEAGRDTLWWGPGYHGAMLISDNSYPLDLVKIGSSHPFRLPWELENFGDLDVKFFVARLEEKRDFSHPYLSGLRMELTPCDYFTFGVSRTVILGGKGRPHLSLSDYWDVVTAPGKKELSQTNPKSTDQKAAVDFKLNLPWQAQSMRLWSNAQVYGEWAGEDKFAPWENEAPGYLAGGLFSDILNIQGLDFRTEFSHANAAWYRHGIYTTGYKYKGNIMGHHMGGDADDFFIRLSKNFAGNQEHIEGFTLGAQFDSETHLRSSAYPERKYEAAIDGVFYLSDTKSVKLFYEREEYKNFGNVSGKGTHNNIFEAEANIKF